MQYSCHGYSNKKIKIIIIKKKKDTFWAHVHWYDRSTRLVTVSGTYTHRAPEAQEVVCIPKEPRQNIVRKTHTFARTHSIMDPLPSWWSRVGRPPLPSSSVTVNIITA